jgi:hypothetical protein
MFCKLGLLGGLARGYDCELSVAIAGGDDPGVEMLGGVEVLYCCGLGEADAGKAVGGVLYAGDGRDACGASKKRLAKGRDG